MTTALAEVRPHPAFDTLRHDLDQLRAAGLYRDFVACSYLADEPGHAIHKDRRIQVVHQRLPRHEPAPASHPGAGRLHPPPRHRKRGSRNIAGTSEAHVALETSLASWHGKERALVFNSGYIANLETLSTLIGAVPDMVVFSDALNHRSLIEGIRRTGADKHVFPHNDLGQLERALAGHPVERPKLIVFESVYSMDGDYAPLREICDLAERYNALTYLDETHAIGTNGPTGAGLCEETGETRVTFVQGVFGKAVGTTGGYVAGPDTALDYVRSHAPGFIFTTTIPRSSLDATVTSLEIIRQDARLRRDLRRNAARMKQALRRAHIDFIDAPSHLVPVLVPGGARIRQVSRRLLDEYGIYVQPVNFPSVPKGGERFRVTVAPFRTPQQIDDFASALRTCLSES